MKGSRVSSFFIIKGGIVTGTELAELMKSKKLNHAIAKHARRYSSRVEDQEEYIQEAWLRIGVQERGNGLDFYEDEGRKAIHAYYMKNVHRKNPKNVNGNSKKGGWDKNKYIHLGRRRYLNKKLETLSGWYYEGEWGDWLYFSDGNYCILKSDADHHGVEYTDENRIDSSFRKKHRVHNIEVEV